MILNKLKQWLGINISEYIIIYTKPLTPYQRTEISTHMINKFGGACKPNSIIVSTQSVGVRLSSPCLTGEQLKKISDDTLVSSKADITCIKLDGNQIWPSK